MPRRVVVAMSGGVDSSVAAALLVEQGYEVIGMMLRLWSEPGCEEDNQCCTPEAMALARRVAARLAIPFYAIDAQDIFYRAVVQAFIQSHQGGETPNPCVACNRLVRWGFLLEQALAIGAEALATGHYARLNKNEAGEWQLRKANDLQKDQSYVLHVLSQEQMAHAIFPLGGYTKPEVRELARQRALPVAERPESQDLCFLGGQDYRDFLIRHAPQIERPGEIIDQAGKKLGQHQGLAGYTIGQRKGLGIAAPAPFYVLRKDFGANALIVGQKSELGQDWLIARDVHWISGRPPSTGQPVQVKIRYKAEPAEAQLTCLAGNRLKASFNHRLRDITPGQAAVFYSGDLCLGGGTIEA